MANAKFVKIREIRVLLPIHVRLCASVVMPFSFRKTLDFTPLAGTARIEQQQFARIE
jgi:hypothetical protein